jgi:ribonuclease Z
MSATWRVTDVSPWETRTVRFELQEAFAVAHDEGSQPHERVILETPNYSVEAVTMDHRTPTLAFVVREKARQNIDTARMAALGLPPGPWLKQIKDAATGAGQVVIGGVPHSVEELRKELLLESPGDSVAYLTDFLLDEPAMERLAEILQGCRTLVCEGQYRHQDLELARKNFHMTTVLTATLARRARVGKLMLFHLSDRYERSVWGEMLREAREIFPESHYPTQWNLESACV